MKVSVIIPTYHRPDLLKETIKSVFLQTILPYEIIIGDDSKDDITEHLVTNEIIPNSPVPIQYFHHKPSLKEVKNVDFQYSVAKGELILHLHDDDPIYPKCIELLSKPFQLHKEIIASFGLQKLINEKGDIIEGSESVNTAYFRTQEWEGIVDGFWAGAVSMFPNNGFMVKKEEVLKIGYNDNGRAGLATDFYFGFRLGKLGKPFYFVNEYTALCRMTSNSQSRTGLTDNAYRAVKIIFEDCSLEQLTPEIETSIRNRIPIAITTAAKIKDKRNALKWMFSKYYRNKLLTSRGIKRIILTLLS